MNRPILNYHSIGPDVVSPLARWTISPDLFHRQLDLLVARGLRGVTMAEALYNPSADEVALTFDDGYEDFVSEAVPALLERGFFASVFVITADVGNPASSLGGGRSRMATWDQLREIDDLGFEVGAHSHTHPQLDLLSAEDVAFEVTTSRQQLQDQLGHEVRGFCYPHGFYSRRVRRAVIDAGFDYSCAVKHKMSSDADDRFALARIVMEDATSTDQLMHWLEGTPRKASSATSWVPPGRPIRDLRPGGRRVERTLAVPFRYYRRAKMSTARSAR